MREDRASKREEQRNIPDFGRKAGAARVKGGPQEPIRAGGEERDVSLLSPCPSAHRLQAHFRRGRGGGPEKPTSRRRLSWSRPATGPSRQVRRSAHRTGWIAPQGGAADARADATVSSGDGEARMNPIRHDFDQPRRDFFACQQCRDELVAEQLDEAGRIGGRDGDERSLRGNKAFRHQTVQMRMKADGFIAVGLQGRFCF